MSDLADLPSSDDQEFWANADMHRVEPKNLFDQLHFFIRIAGHQAQCNHCWWGFQLEPGDKVIDGHLFNRDGKRVL